MAQLTKQALIVENNTSFPNNNTNYITPAILRSFNTDMIDSTVNQGVYTTDSGSWNRSISSLNAFTASAAGLSTGSLLVTASANINVITFTKGDGTTFNVTVADTTNLTPLNQFTASQATINTAIGASTSSLNTFTSSANTQLTNLATSQSIDATKFATIGTQSGSWGAGSSPGIISGSAQISALGFVSSSVTASSLVTASVNVNILTFTKGDGSQFNLTVAASGSVTPGTVSGSAQIVGLGFLQTSSFQTYTSSIDNKFISVGASTASLNAYTSSADSKFVAIGASTASLNSATASLFTSTSLSLYTASISGQLLSFTKGNNTGFTLTIPTGSGTYVTGSYGAFQDSTTQSGSANIAYKMKFNTTDASDGVILSGSTGLKVGAYGTYNLEWSGQLNEGSGAETTSVWISINGVYVSGSRGDITVASNSNLLPAWNYFLTLNQNDVVELWWSSTGPNTTWVASPAGVTPTRPSVASIIATLSRVDVGGGSNSVSNATFNAYTSSINAYTASNDTKWNTLQTTTASFSASVASISALTGSYATTGSNVFTGDQTFIDPSGNTVTLTDGSGSLILVAKGFTSASAHISASAGNQVNLIFKNNNNTTDTIISGSNNIFTNALTATAGFKRYVGGNNNYYNANAIPQISSSMAFSPAMNRNLGGLLMTLRGPVSSSTYTLSDNIGLSVNVQLGTNTGASSFEKMISGYSFNQNAIFGGAINQTAGITQLDDSGSFNTNLIIGATVTINNNSSSVNYSSNIQNGNITINNNYISASGATGNFRTVHSTINTIYGVSQVMQFAGSNTSTNRYRSATANLLAGTYITASLQETGDNTSMIGVSILGNALVVSASSLSPLSISPLTDATYGSVFTGRFNATDGNKAKTAETIFAIGTGTSYANKKTGFLIDSGSNTFIEGTLNVSGSSSFTGSVNGNVVSMSITSNTASMDFSLGNYFELTASVTPLNINVTNLKGGTTKTLSLSGSTASTITFSPNVQQPSGSLYTASVSGQTDILSFVAFNTSKVNVVSTLKMV